MGNTLNGCCSTKEETPYIKGSFFFEKDFADSRMTCSERNDERFYFIKNEIEIDKAINRFDELITISQEEAAKLDDILNELRVLRKKYCQIGSITSPSNSYHTDSSSQDLKRHANPRGFFRNTLSNDRSKTPLSLSRDQILKETNKGSLVLEVQKAIFTQPKLIKSHNLTQPYIVVKVYHCERKQEGKKSSQRMTEVASYSTSKNSKSIKPEWNELFQYDFVNHERKVNQYKVGLTLYYQKGSSDKYYKAGEEQMFGLASLFDQKLQNKRIIYKQKLWKGTLAKVHVRFQFVYNAEELRDRIYNDIKTKIEKLIKIRERHPIFDFGKAGNHSMMLSLEKTITNLDMSLASSNHETDVKYYFS